MPYLSCLAVNFLIKDTIIDFSVDGDMGRELVCLVIKAACAPVNHKAPTGKSADSTAVLFLPKTGKKCYSGTSVYWSHCKAGTSLTFHTGDSS